MNSSNWARVLLPSSLASPSPSAFLSLSPSPSPFLSPSAFLLPSPSAIPSPFPFPSPAPCPAPWPASASAASRSSVSASTSASAPLQGLRQHGRGGGREGSLQQMGSSPPWSGKERSLVLRCMAEAPERSSRRDIFAGCLLGLVALPFARQSDEAVAAVDGGSPVKGRRPSSPFDADRILEQNRRMQKLNNAPDEFPGFVREGFEVKVVTNESYVTTNTGLIYYDVVVGQGETPKDGQQVVFHYIGYNENGRRVDSSYQQGQPAKTRLGIKGMIPGFEEGIKTMRTGGKRRIIIPPELGPPVGPSTFFSAKQFEVFDVELLDVKDCNRRTVFLYSDVVCE